MAPARTETDHIPRPRARAVWRLASPVHVRRTDVTLGRPDHMVSASFDSFVVFDASATPNERVVSGWHGLTKLAEAERPNEEEINSQRLYLEPQALNTKKELPTVPKNSFKKGVYY